MPKMRIIGLTGPVQNGKIQLTPVFQALGWKFIDLNDAVYDARPKGTAEYDRLNRMIPGCLDDEGVETGRFYQQITPEGYRQLLTGYTKQVREAAERACIYRRPHERIVLSWEYLSRISSSLPLDHMLLFHSERNTWYRRMKQRVAEISGRAPSDEWLDQLIHTLDVDPERILEEATAAMGRDRLTLVDVTPEGWGEQNLRAVLNNWA